MSPADLPWLALAASVAAGSLVQGATGFGGSLVATPLMLWGGMTLPQAIAANTDANLVQTGVSCWRHRLDLPWRASAPLMALRLLFVPVGVLALTGIARLGQETVKQIVGLTLLALVTALVAFRVQPRPRVSPVTTLVAGTTSGFLAGAFGIGGPPLVLWSLQQDWPPQRVRVFLWLTSLVLVPPALILLVMKFGSGVLAHFVAALLLSPAITLSTRAGMSVGQAWSRLRLRQVAYGMLVITALVSICSPFLRRPSATAGSPVVKVNEAAPATPPASPRRTPPGP